uniref:Ppr10 n=1 Tax=Arundo donax TaxID=35708 RepID=A0A0A9CZU8_ARUDO
MPRFPQTASIVFHVTRFGVHPLLDISPSISSITVNFDFFPSMPRIRL